jgi:hypothetical protein
MTGQPASASLGSVVFKPVGGFEVTDVPDGFVIYDDQNGKVHYLNPTAAVVYTVCDGEKTVDELAMVVKDLYELDDQLALDGFFIELEKAGLVCRAG